MQAAGLVAHGFHLLLEHYKIGKLQECRTTIVAGDWRLVAQGIVLHAFGLTLGPLESYWEWFGGLWVDLGSHCVHIGCPWVILGSWLVTFGAPRLHFGRSWELLGSILESLGLILGASGIKNADFGGSG